MKNVEKVYTMLKADSNTITVSWIKLIYSLGIFHERDKKMFSLENQKRKIQEK